MKSGSGWAAVAAVGTLLGGAAAIWAAFNSTVSDQRGNLPTPPISADISYPMALECLVMIAEARELYSNAGPNAESLVTGGSIGLSIDPPLSTSQLGVMETTARSIALRKAPAGSVFSDDLTNVRVARGKAAWVNLGRDGDLRSGDLMEQNRKRLQEMLPCLGLRKASSD